jgi:hypothetical protein
VNPHPKLLAEFYANIEKIGRIADELQASADETRDFLARVEAAREKHDGEWSRPEARIQPYSSSGNQ